MGVLVRVSGVGYFNSPVMLGPYHIYIAHTTRLLPIFNITIK